MIPDPEGLAAVLDWVPKMVTRYRPTAHPDFQDTVQEGLAAAFMAWLDADTDKAPRDFYARRRANMHVLAFVQGKRRPLSSVRYSSGQVMDRSVPDDGMTAMNSRVESPEDAALAAAMVAALLPLLDARQLELVRRKFWLDETAAQVANAMGMSPAWVASQWLTIRNTLAAAAGAPVKNYAGRTRKTA